MWKHHLFINIYSWYFNVDSSQLFSMHQFSSVQLFSHVRLFATLWTTARQASLSITNSRSLPKLMSIESVMPSNHLILYLPILLSPSIFPSITVFSWVNSSHEVPKYWSFSFNICSSNEYSGLISFRIDSLDLLAVQGTLKSLLQHQFKSINSSALNFLYSSTLTSIHDYWKNHSFDKTTFVGKVMSLLFNMLSRLVITFLFYAYYLPK